MGRFNDALQRLACRGYFSMDPHDPVIEVIPLSPEVELTAVTTDATAEQPASESSPSGPVEAEIVEVHDTHVDSDFHEEESAALSQVECLAEELANTLYEPLVVDAGLKDRRTWLQFHGPEPLASAEQSDVLALFETSVDTELPIARIEKIHRELDALQSDDPFLAPPRLDEYSVPTDPVATEASPADMPVDGGAPDTATADALPMSVDKVPLAAELVADTLPYASQREDTSATNADELPIEVADAEPQAVKSSEADGEASVPEAAMIDVEPVPDPWAIDDSALAHATSETDSDTITAEAVADDVEILQCDGEPSSTTNDTNDETIEPELPRDDASSSSDRDSQTDAVMHLMETVLGISPHILKATQQQDEADPPPGDQVTDADVPEAAEPQDDELTRCEDMAGPTERRANPTVDMSDETAELIPELPSRDSVRDDGDGESMFKPVMETWAEFPELEVVDESVEDTADSSIASTVEPDEVAVEREGPCLTDWESPSTEPLMTAFESRLSPPTAYETEMATRLLETPYGQRIQNLRNELFAYLSVDDANVVLLVSTDSDNQRADAAAALAMLVCGTLAQPTLLVDADTETQRISRVFDQNGSGLIEALSGESPWHDSVQSTSCERLKLLPCGSDVGFISPDSNQEEYRHVAQLVEHWRQQYGLVIVDGGPVDSPLVPVLTQASHATFVCVKLGASQREELVAAVERLETAGGKVFGCITTGPEPTEDVADVPE